MTFCWDAASFFDLITWDEHFFIMASTLAKVKTPFKLKMTTVVVAIPVVPRAPEVPVICRYCVILRCNHQFHFIRHESKSLDKIRLINFDFQPSYRQKQSNCPRKVKNSQMLRKNSPISPKSSLISIKIAVCYQKQPNVNKKQPNIVIFQPKIAKYSQNKQKVDQFQ